LTGLPAGVGEIAPELWRWTTPHPNWRPGAEPGSPADWEREVGSVACLTDTATVFVDPLLPEERGDLWAWAGELVARRPRTLALTTVSYHRRSRDQLVERFGASTSRARTSLGEGIEAIRLRRAGETVYWLAEQRTLVPGDRILGQPGGGLRTCPASWLRSDQVTVAELRALLRPLLELPVERVLVSHGEPVLARGREALARMLG
jgi:hypothetical protein